MKRMGRWVVMIVWLTSLLSLFGCHKTDGDGMERALWTECDLSIRSDVYEQNKTYTVRLDAKTQRYVLYVHTLAEEDERGVRLKDHTVNELLAQNVFEFPDKPPRADNNGDEAMMLDGTTYEFSVVDMNGQRFNKVISAEQASKWQALFEPYI